MNTIYISEIIFVGTVNVFRPLIVIQSNTGMNTRVELTSILSDLYL